MDTIILRLITIEANQATIDIAKKMHKAIDTKIESFHGHSEHEEQFQTTVGGIIKSFTTVLDAFDNAKTTCEMNNNYFPERNKTMLHTNVVAIQQNYADVL